jgi:microcystin-dependent protein
MEHNNDLIIERVFKKCQERLVPIGSILPFSGEIAPTGWLLCDGKQYTSQDYPDLYEVIKTKYIPSSEQWVFKANEVHPVKIFYVPDLRGRVIVGIDGGKGRVTSNNTLGASGGEEKHKLTIEELASHNHNMGLKYEHIYALGQGCLATNLTSPNLSTHNSGGDKPHNNMQPYICLNYIINTGKVKN